MSTSVCWRRSPITRPLPLFDLFVIFSSSLWPSLSPSPLSLPPSPTPLSPKNARKKESSAGNIGAGHSIHLELERQPLPSMHCKPRLLTLLLKHMLIGTFLILLGAIMIGLFGVVPEPSHSLEDLIELWKRPAFIIYFSLIELTVVSLLVANRIVEKVLTRNAQASLAAHQRTGSVSDIGGGGGAGSINNNSLNLDMHSGPYGKLLGNRAFGKLSPTKIKTILGISYGCVGGMLSSQALLFAKSAIELLYLTIVEGQNQFENPLSWFLVVALITAALLQVCISYGKKPPSQE